MSQSTNINNFIINKLTKAQYDALATIDPTQLYMVVDDLGISYADLIQILGFTPQKTIVAGGGVTITRGDDYDTISASGGSGGSYTAGNGITISNNEISIADAVVFNCGTSTTVV